MEINGTLSFSNNTDLTAGDATNPGTVDVKTGGLISGGNGGCDLDVTDGTTTNSISGHSGYNISGPQNAIPSGPGFTSGSLPVVLTYFECKSIDNSIAPSSLYASELNNDRFDIEKSENGIDFETIGIVAGYGNSNELIDYTYTDNNVSRSSSSCYRLKQVDYDGQFEYSSVSCSKPNENRGVEVYPNPFQNKIVILGKSQKQILTVEISDIQGRLLSVHRFEKGYVKEISTADLTSGTFFITVNGKSQRLIKN